MRTTVTGPDWPAPTGSAAEPSRLAKRCSRCTAPRCCGGAWLLRDASRFDVSEGGLEHRPRVSCLVPTCPAIPPLTSGFALGAPVARPRVYDPVLTGLLAIR